MYQVAQGHGAPAIPEELLGVRKHVLEEYVQSRIRHFSRQLAAEINPSLKAHELEVAFARAQYSLGASQTVNPGSQLGLRFAHSCKFLGCLDKECKLCKNNPNKRCDAKDNFDNCYADSQVLKSKCDADIVVELYSLANGAVVSTNGLEIQVCVIDGEGFVERDRGQGRNQVMELLKSDEGVPLLGCSGTYKVDHQGRLLMNIQSGKARLPDLHVTDKNDTFKTQGQSYSTFRLYARAVQRDRAGNLHPIDAVEAAVSAKFVVKTQRALNDYRKCEYPHYKDELTKLRFIGSITAQRLKDVQAHLGKDVPFYCIETVESLKQLMEYADTNRQCENKLLELLNMKGKHKHKWDYLRGVLSERIVFDDNVYRAWFADETSGLLFQCKQAQINFEKPAGILQRLQPGRLQVLSVTDPKYVEVVKDWRQQAEQDWDKPGHSGWTMVTETLEYNNGTSQNMSVAMQTISFSISPSPPSGRSPALSPAQSASISAQEDNKPSLVADLMGRGAMDSLAQTNNAGSYSVGMNAPLSPFHTVETAMTASQPSAAATGVAPSSPFQRSPFLDAFGVTSMNFSESGAMSLGAINRHMAGGSVITSGGGSIVNGNAAGSISSQLTNGLLSAPNVAYQSAMHAGSEGHSLPGHTSSAPGFHHMKSDPAQMDSGLGVNLVTAAPAATQQQKQAAQQQPQQQFSGPLHYASQAPLQGHLSEPQNLGRSETGNSQGIAAYDSESFPVPREGSKRGRNPAAALLPELDLGASQGTMRTAFYHMESRGRHFPRFRALPDEDSGIVWGLAPSEAPNPTCSTDISAFFLPSPVGPAPTAVAHGASMGSSDSGRPPAASDTAGSITSGGLVKRASSDRSAGSASASASGRGSLNGATTDGALAAAAAALLAGSTSRPPLPRGLDGGSVPSTPPSAHAAHPFDSASSPLIAPTAEDTLIAETFSSQLNIDGSGGPTPDGGHVGHAAAIHEEQYANIFLPPRVLRHCDSDSFKRFLGDVLPTEDVPNVEDWFSYDKNGTEHINVMF